MASHFARWTVVHGTPPVHRLPHDLIQFASTLAEKRRVRYLTSRALLAELMFLIYGFTHLPALIQPGGGRPAFADKDLPDFSIAYAGMITGVLLAEEGGHAGLGIEIVRAHSRQAQEQYLRDLSAAERAWINAQADPEEASAQLWAMRKSLLKLPGGTEWPRDALRLHPASGRLRSLCCPDIQAISDVEPLLIWSCALSPGSERLQFWELDEQQRWARLWEMQVNRSNMGQRVLRMTSLPVDRIASA